MSPVDSAPVVSTEQGTVENGQEAIVPKAAVATKKGKKSVKKAAAVVKKGDEPTQVGAILQLSLENFTAYENPRHEPERLYDLGYSLIGKHPSWEPEPTNNGDQPEERLSLLHMALSDDMDKVRQFVKMIEEHESVNRKEQPNAPQSIVELAEDLSLFKQLIPVTVRKNKTGYTLVDGGRRVSAIAYNYAKSRVDKADGVEGAKLAKPFVTAMEANISQDEVFRTSVLLNLSRKEFNPLQEGRVYHETLKRTNPATGKPFVLKEVASMFNVKMGTCRNREALWHPFKPAVKDDEGNVIKQAKGLKDEDRRKLAEGKMTLTAATRKALGERGGDKSGEPKLKRAKAIPLAEMQRLFDETGEVGEKNEIRRKAIAECMGIPFSQAVKESEERIQNADRVDMGGRKKKSK